MSRLHWLATPALLATLVLTVSNSDALAQQTTASASTTTQNGVDVVVRGMADAPLKMRRDKAEILRLESDAASVIVGNPDLVSINVETPRRIVLIPVDEGMTTLTILDSQGEVITERALIVSSNSDANFVRVRRICPDSAGCEDRDVYYCEAGSACHTVVNEPTQAAMQNNSATESTTTSSGETESTDEALTEATADQDAATQEIVDNVLESLAQ